MMKYAKPMKGTVAVLKADVKTRTMRRKGSNKVNCRRKHSACAEKRCFLFLKAVVNETVTYRHLLKKIIIL
jgi:hypothetical protein